MLTFKTEHRLLVPSDFLPFILMVTNHIFLWIREKKTCGKAESEGFEKNGSTIARNVNYININASTHLRQYFYLFHNPVNISQLICLDTLTSTEINFKML